MPKHGGWENWETWQMAMILDQRQDFDGWLSREIEENDIAAADAAGMIEQTGQKIREFIDQDVPQLQFPWENLLEHVLDSVDWSSLARRYLIGTKRLTKRGRRPAEGPKEWNP